MQSSLIVQGNTTLQLVNNNPCNAMQPHHNRNIRYNMRLLQYKAMQWKYNTVKAVTKTI